MWSAPEKTVWPDIEIVGSNFSPATQKLVAVRVLANFSPATQKLVATNIEIVRSNLSPAAIELVAVRVLANLSPRAEGTEGHKKSYMAIRNLKGIKSTNRNGPR